VSVLLAVVLAVESTSAGPAAPPLPSVVLPSLVTTAGSNPQPATKTSSARICFQYRSARALTRQFLVQRAIAIGHDLLRERQIAAGGAADREREQEHRCDAPAEAVRGLADLRCRRRIGRCGRIRAHVAVDLERLRRSRRVTDRPHRSRRALRISPDLVLVGNV